MLIRNNLPYLTLNVTTFLFVSSFVKIMILCQHSREIKLQFKLLVVLELKLLIILCMLSMAIDDKYGSNRKIFEHETLVESNGSYLEMQ